MKTSIPITKALAREKVRAKSNTSGVYPLFTNYQENYNFNNICESLNKWYLYSNKNDKNINQMLHLYRLVNENGTIKEIEIAADIVTSNIISIPGYASSVPQLKAMDNTENIIEAVEEACVCDKVVKNYEDLCKRFRVNYYIQEHCRDLESCIHELCSFVDTYNIGINTKYRIALEEVYYGLTKNGVHCTQKEIIEHVTDYFLMHSMDSKDTTGTLLDIMENVLKINPIISDDSYIRDIRESMTAKPVVVKEGFDTLEEAVVTESYIETAEKAIMAFKGGADKGTAAFRDLINKLLTVHEEQDIIDGTANVLSMSFYFFIVIGIASISAWAGIASLITLTIISKAKDYNIAKKVLKKWYEQRSKVKEKLKKEQDPQKKKRLETYLSEMNKSIEKIEQHYDRLAPEGDSAVHHDTSGNDDFDLDMKFESVEDIANQIDQVMGAMKSIKWNSDIANKVFGNKDTYLNATPESVDFVTEFTCKFPYMVDHKAIAEAMTEAVKTLRKNSTSEAYTRIATLNECRGLINNISDDIVIEENTENVIQNLNELRYMSDVIGHTLQSYNELSMGSTLSLAIDKMIDTAKNLDVKAQIAARTIDSASRLISHSIEKSLTSESRESVIRGEILPSMSKCVKLAIMTGGAFLISPALAIVALIVRFVISKRIQAKERQLVLNELDVELNMVDRYIRQAEEKNDLKKVRELLLIKKKLQSQYARLRYNLKIEWNDKDVQELRGKEEE